MVINFSGWFAFFILVYTLIFMVSADAMIVNILVMMLMGWGVICVCIQFSEKCPNCQYRIGFSTRLFLPKNCKKCGIVYQNNDG